MNQEIILKLWVSVHLLYPNTSQAQDVFENILDVILSEKIDSQVDIFKFVFGFFKKNKPVKSLSQFLEFPENDLSLWRQALQKCTIEEVEILICVMAIGFSVSETAEILKTTKNRVVYLLNQALRKFIQYHPQKASFEQKVRFKKFNEQLKSQTFVQEQLVEVTLNLTDEKTKTILQKQIEEIPHLKDFQKKIHDFYLQLSNLRPRTPLADITPAAEEIVEIEKQAKLMHLLTTNYRWVVAIVLMISSMSLLMVFRPAFLFQNRPNAVNPSYVIEEVKIKKDNMDQANPDEGLIAANDNSDKENFNDSKLENKNVAKNEVVNKANDHKADSKIDLKVDSKAESTTAVMKDGVGHKVADSKTPATNAKVTSVSAVGGLPHAVPAAVANAGDTLGSNKDAKKNSGLFRGTLYVSDIDQVTRLLKDKVVVLGGRKAGEVELGWKKTSGTSYFHFVLPDENVDQVQKYMKQFGDYSAKFEPHPRLVPIGQKRFIIEVHESE